MTNLAPVILEIERLIEAFPELADDEHLRLDMIEGETDALEIATRLARLHVHADAMASAVKQEADGLASRRKRYEDQAARAKASLRSLLGAMGQRKLELGPATVSLKAVPPSLVITDAEAIPEGYQRVKHEPDKTAIKNELKAGGTVPGCTLSNGGETIAVRVA